MQIIIKHETNLIKNGWSVRAPQLGIAAHGHSEEIARLNLERGIRLFLQPFLRNNTFQAEAAGMGLAIRDNGNDDGLVVTLE